MIRCNNCGWSNDASLVRCEKCNAPLKGSMVKGLGNEQAPSNPVHDNSALAGTQVGQAPSTPYWDQQNIRNCPACGYPNMADAQNCIRCKAAMPGFGGVAANPGGAGNVAGVSAGKKGTNPPVVNDGFSKEGKKVRIIESGEGQAAEEKVNFNKTTDPYRQIKKTKCYLEPLTAPGETDMAILELVGNEVPLNRSSVDPGNNTITSKVQAVIKSENGAFTIEDKSDQQTTFIQAGKPYELHNGDIILMGNRKFRFRTED